MRLTVKGDSILRLFFRRALIGLVLVTATVLGVASGCLNGSAPSNSQNNDTNGTNTTESTCDPVDQTENGAIYRLPVGGGAPTKLVSGLALPWAIRVDGNTLYFAEDGTGNCTGTIKTIAANASPGTASHVIVSGLDRPNLQVIYQGYIYFTLYKDAGAGAVYRVNLATGVKTPLVEGLNRPFGVRVESLGNDTWVYFTEDGSSINNYTDGTVKKFHIGSDGSVDELITLADNLRRPLGLAMDSDYLYVVEMDGGRVSRMGKDLVSGVKPLQENLMTGLLSPYPPVLEGGVLYFAEFNPADSAAGKIYKLTGVNSPDPITAVNASDCVSSSNSPLYCTLLTQSLSWPMAVALDGTRIYWTEIYSPSIKSVKIDGSDPMVLADGTLYGFKTSPWLVTDGSYVYFVDLGDVPCCFTRF